MVLMYHIPLYMCTHVQTYTTTFLAGTWKKYKVGLINYFSNPLESPKVKLQIYIWD